MSKPDSQDAREQLRAAQDAGGSGDAISRASRAADGAYSVAIGVALGLFLLAVVYVYPTRILWLVVAVTLGYAAAVGVSVAWYLSRRRARGLGWSKRYSSGFAISMAFYAIGIALLFSTGISTPLFWVPFAALVAAPLAIAGLARGAR